MLRHSGGVGVFGACLQHDEIPHGGLTTIFDFIGLLVIG